MILILHFEYGTTCIPIGTGKKYREIDLKRIRVKLICEYLRFD